MNVPRLPQPRKRKRSRFRLLFAVTVTTAMIATGGFGAFPDNPLTETFQEVISENVSADYLQPFNSYMENVSAPTIQPKPRPASASDQPFDLIGTLFGAGDLTAASIPTFSLEEINTSIAGFSASMTAVSAGTATAVATLSTGTPPSTPTFISTLTLLPSATFTVVPTATFPPLIIYPTSTKKPTSLPPDTPTATATNTVTPTATASPAGFTLSGISLNTLTNGGAIFTFPSNTFTVNYSYTVWAQSNCAGCIIQLVSGMGASGGVGTTSCAYNGQPGIAPGTSGTSSLTLTAPATVGTYNIVVQLSAQPDCATAISNYSGASGIYQTIGQVVVHSAVNVVFDGGLHDGNLGGRSGADAICVAAKPGTIGNPNVRALAAFSTSDTIAGMPSLSPPVPDNIPVVFQDGQLIGKDWADMLDGSINAALTLSGVPSGRWWSGAETDAGTVLGGTANCNGFTSNLSSDWGNAGNTALSGANWMNVAGNSQTCDQSFRLICLAHP